MTRLVEVHAGTARFPDGLWAAMGAPRRVAALPFRRTPQFTLWPYDLSFVRANFRPWLRSRFGSGDSVGIVSAEEEQAEVRGLPIPDGSYGVINRRTHFVLTPADHEATEGDYWRELPNYQEHRPPGDQKSDHHAMTEELVSRLATLEGESFLEVGCGAGRNLVGLARHLPSAALGGVDIHPSAIENARAALPGASCEVGDLHELSPWADNSWDVVFTSGTLMHVEHDRVERVIRELNRIARCAVVHYEYHGPSHDFDYRYYPRDYEAVYTALQLPRVRVEYDVLDRRGYRKRLSGPFQHCVLVASRVG